MKERPILFSAPMVQALLAGTKTVTRRTIADAWWRCLDPQDEDDRRAAVTHNPYGTPGDRLWVKETWRPEASSMGHRLGWKITYRADGAVLFSDLARVDEDWRCPKAAKTGNVTPLFMPRWASRLTLEVVAVSVERLHDITEDDILREGVTVPHVMAWTGTPWSDMPTLHDAWRVLWEHINGAGTYAVNPWVWRVEFARRATP